ncbi:MAG: family 10 glycosylhydrolase, partial [Armatimonadetes bacterium]|nr:family 10 glycosylhydrolase [Armatimonadota bacterium]
QRPRQAQAGPAGLVLHGVKVTAEGLHFDAGEKAWAVLPVPAELAKAGGLRLEARFRLDRLAAGQVPALLFGRAGLYVFSDGRPMGVFWTGERRSDIVPSIKLAPGRWYELALDYRPGGLVSLYLDGELVARRLAGGPLQPGDSKLVLGRWQWTEKGQLHYSYLSGDVEWVRLRPPQAPTPADLHLPLGFTKAVSWGDIILEGEAVERSQIRDYLASLARQGYQQVHWRLSAAVLREYHRRAPEKLWVPYIRRYYKLVDETWARFDPIEAACEDCHRLGMKVYGWLTIFDEGAPPDVLYAGSVPFPWQSKFTIEHPECVVCDRQGQRQRGVLEYAYRQARRYKVAQIVHYAKRYDLDGIFISTRSHSPPAQDADRFGFNEPIVQAYRRRYGRDILHEDFSLDAWRRLRGEQVTQLLRELRAAMPAGKRLAIGIPRGDWFGPPYGNMHIDWRTWVREGLIDELVIGEISGKGLYPSFKEYRGYIFDQEARVGLRPLLVDVEKVFGPLCRKYGVQLYVQGFSQEPAFWRDLEQGLCGVRR